MTDLALTPSQTTGPYLTIGLLGGTIANSSSMAPTRARSASRACFSTVPDSRSRTADRDLAGERSRPLCASGGRSRGDPLEDGFTGFGRSGTEEAGRFEFVTVKPGRVPWVDGRLQAPHLLVGVFARGLLKRVATRMYFPDEEAANAELGLEPEERMTVARAAEDGGLRFDIVLQGPGQTTFFAV